MTERREGGQVPSVRVFSVSSSLLLVLAGVLPGCGGGLPLLHPARTLESGDVRALAGFSSSVAVGGLASAIRNAANEGAAHQGPPNPGNAAYAEGALVAASIAPGLAPIVGARVGLGSQAEGGLVYTGRAVRADLRRSFDVSSTWALSVGAGGSAALYGRAQTDALPGVDLGRLHGWGADVPILIGYQSDGDLYMFWAGARAGWEHVNIDDVTRFWGGGLLGAAVGFRHVHVAMELDASYASITGDYGGTRAHIVGVSLAPATALWWRF